MGAKLTEEFEAEVELIEGDNGIFEVAVDGEPLFSKHELGRFPEDEEVVATLRARM